jgi:hypothetical protein
LHLIQRGEEIVLPGLTECQPVQRHLSRFRWALAKFLPLQ